MVYIFYLLIAVSLCVISTNWNYLQYNNIFNKFNYIEATTYMETGYTSKGNICLLFILVLIISIILIIRDIYISIKDTKKETKDE